MLVSTLLAVIAIHDVKTHRIPNVYLLILVGLCLYRGIPPMHIRYVLLCLLLIFIFTYLSHCGLGDTKLAMIICTCVIPRSRIIDYLLLLLLTSTAMVVTHMIRTRDMNGDIAFAPALCGAVLALNSGFHF